MCTVFTDKNPIGTVSKSSSVDKDGNWVPVSFTLLNCTPNISDVIPFLLEIIYAVHIPIEYRPTYKTMNTKDNTEKCHNHSFVCFSSFWVVVFGH